MIDDIKFVDIALSKSNEGFAAAIDQDGFVYSWGSNDFG